MSTFGQYKSHHLRWLNGATIFLILLLCLIVFGSIAPTILQVNAASGTTTSSTEAGYAITATKGSVKSVSGSWLMPSITCPTTGSTEVDFVVGIDNYPTWIIPPGNEVGTDARCYNGQSNYFAFYLYPGASGLLFIGNVKPKDVIKGSVSYVSGVFYFVFKDVTSGLKFSASKAETGTSRSSAGWIIGVSEIALSSFGAFFSGLKFTSISGTDYATIGSHSGSIGSFKSVSGDTVLQVNLKDFFTGATTSLLSDSGTSFYDEEFRICTTC
jgi:hypothetical protein